MLVTDRVGLRKAITHQKAPQIAASHRQDRNVKGLDPQATRSDKLRSHGANSVQTTAVKLVLQADTWRNVLLKVAV